MSIKKLALLGTTASGKTSLAIKLAQEYNCIILSLDSLSVYKEIDISSAKPSLEEQKNIMHFGINEIYPNDNFNVVLFFDLYKKAKKYAKKYAKNLIIVGGSSFYLKAMLQGLSYKHHINNEIKNKIEKNLLDLNSVFELIKSLDKEFANKIKSNDKYRIEKWLEIYYSTNEIPSIYLKNNLQKPIIKNLGIYEIITPKEILKNRIITRTNTMINNGLIEEVFYLEKKYSRLPKCMGSIGIKEVLEYLDGRLSLEEMEEKIILNTLHLGKRQQTFNKTQFNEEITRNSLKLIEKDISYFLKN